METLEELNKKYFELILKYKKEYDLLIKKGISYEQLRSFIETDYNIFLKKQEKIKSIDPFDEDAGYRLYDAEQITTDIKSESDAICKYKALQLVKDNITNGFINKNTTLD